MGWYLYFFTCLFISFCAVSAKMSDCIIDNGAKSWIGAEDIKIMIEETIHDAKCCNIIISDDSHATVELFNQFVKIYRNAYTVNKMVYECTGFFVISSTVENAVADLSRIPTTMSTTEMLIIVDDHVKESTKLLNIPTYQNAKVNIAARNGLWSLSEIYFRPRVFKAISKAHGLKRKHGIVNLQGQELQVAAFYRPPFCYLSSTVNRTVNGIEREFFSKTNTNETELDGMEVKLFLLIAEKLNFTWSIRKPNQYRYGERNGSDWNGGVIGAIFHNEVDMAFSGIMVTLDFHLFSNLTYPWMKLYIHLLVPRPKPYASFWALATPLSGEVWSALFVMLVIQSVFVYTSARMHTAIPKRFRSFTITWTEMMGRLLGTVAPKKMHGLQLQFQLWHFLGILMITAYSCSLAAKLAKREYDKRIDTIEDFIKANLTWGREDPEPKPSVFVDETDPLGKELLRRFALDKDKPDRQRKILQGNYAIMGRMIGPAVFPVSDVGAEYLKGYRVMAQSLTQYHTAFAVQPWLLKSVNVVMLRLQQSGLVNYHMSEILHRKTPRSFRRVLVEYDVAKENTRILQLKPLGIAFSLFFVGLSISIIVFYFELRSVRGSRSIWKVLLDIKKSREISQIHELRIVQYDSRAKKLFVTSVKSQHEPKASVTIRRVRKSVFHEYRSKFHSTRRENEVFTYAKRAEKPPLLHHVK